MIEALMDKLTASKRMMEIFRGRESIYGIAKVDTSSMRDDGKVKALYSIVKKPYTLENWKNHIDGELGLGLFPIMEDNQCYWGALDFDVYKDVDIVSVLQSITKLKFPLTVVQSKSGGLHCYLVCNSKCSARGMRNLLFEMKTILGLPDDKTEIFPKQDEISTTEHLGNGNFLNMPYFNEDSRRMIKLSKDKKSFETIETVEEFLKELTIISDQDFKDIYTKLTKGEIQGDDNFKEMFLEAPPCIERACKKGLEAGNRNNMFHEIAKYLGKRFGSADPDRLNQYNKYVTASDGPISLTEITSIARSANGKDYYYGCTKPTCKDHCNSQLCIQRKYGIDGDQALPNITSITKVNRLDDPTYIVELKAKTESDVSSSTVYLSKDEITEPRAFHKAVMVQADRFMPILTRNKFMMYIQPYFQKMVLQEPTEDTSIEEEIKDNLITFLEENMSDDKLYLTEINGVVEDIEKEYILFKLDDFYRVLVNKKVIAPMYSKIKLAKFLENTMSIGSTRITINDAAGRRRNIRCRTISTDILSEVVDES